MNVGKVSYYTAQQLKRHWQSSHSLPKSVYFAIQ